MVSSNSLDKYASYLFFQLTLKLVYKHLNLKTIHVSHKLISYYISGNIYFSRDTL